ncbi:hypothetical protein FOZ61_002627 [Perkinsus olseni]|uniref:Uncharacterized protein n=1 Tax=Perkinsus olseni TaxID=32597 RepID=A0A7J6M3E8_PEROL|nr:hypothetical protein FOZ61_002627 [Perkinsus olseni]KAF4666024.1 hypothetical protein FOL46_003327 [Perkinsus olseni]
MTPSPVSVRTCLAFPQGVRPLSDVYGRANHRGGDPGRRVTSSALPLARFPMVRLLLSLLIPSSAVLGSPRTKGSYRNTGGPLHGCYIVFDGAAMGFQCPHGCDIFEFMDNKWRYSPSIKQPTQKDEDSHYDEIMLWDDLRRHQWPAHNKLKLSSDTREILLETPSRTYKFGWVNLMPRPFEEEPVMAMEGPREERSWGIPEEIEQGRKDFARLRDKQLI